MRLTINPNHIVCGTFGNLETFDPEWLNQLEHWEDYMRAFFQSNGLTYSRELDSRVNACINASDKASFSSMVDLLLPKITVLTSVKEVKNVIMAHWTPDLHLGTSVVNHAIHSLNLSSECFGLAISDRGLSAPLFALECLYRNFKDVNQSALLIVADQKNLLYKSELMSQLSPLNSACILKLETNGIGWQYQGYRKISNVSLDQFSNYIEKFKSELMLSKDTKIIGPSNCLEMLPNGEEHLVVKPKLLCSAPFFALKNHADVNSDYLIVVYEQNTLYAIGLHH